MLRLEVSGHVFATFREAMGKVRKVAGEPLDDDAALLLLCRQALEGPKDTGRASYQIALTVCESCRRGHQQGRGELVEVSTEVVEMAECDGQVIGRGDAHVGADDKPRPGESNPRAHVRDILARAAQAIPPAIRRAVFLRDGKKCRVPGCRHSTFVDVHHLTRWCEGGGNRLNNLVTLCGAHHQAIHNGTLLVTGSASSTLYFTHADGTPYGGAPAAAVADARAKAFQALTVMGYREGQAKRALARVPCDPVPLEQIIRQALRELAPR